MSVAAPDGATARRVRTRVAPSPTGDPHVGTAYVALVNYCFAKQHGGDFLLRIEDTDQARSTPESERAILAALRWTGLTWDEGPDVGGPYGPYRQSERSALYRRYADELLANGHAFRCFCTPARLEEMRAAQRAAGIPQKYDGRCLHVPADESAARAAAGEPFVVRMKVPAEGICIVNDLARGPVPFEYATVDMQVLMKADGLPTYHLANVVDDHLMEITHVIRGEEWLPSAPKHLLLYGYFGWEAPVLMHLPLLRNPDKSKLSKRKNPTGILFYQRMGYLPEALLNFLGLLVAPVNENDDEMFTVSQLAQRLNLTSLSLSGPVFDVSKLDWLNGRYLHRKTVDDLEQVIYGWGFRPERIKSIVLLAAKRMEKLTDLGELTGFFFMGRVPISRDDLLAYADSDFARHALAFAMWRLDNLRTFDKEHIEQELKRVATEDLNRRFKDVARLFFVAITGRPTSVPLFDSMQILGRDICRERLRFAIELLGGVSEKDRKRWEQRRHKPEPIA